MSFKLAPIEINEDKFKSEYASDDCQNLLKMWKDYYPIIGFNFPWVGYFVLQDDKIVGCCAFTGKPNEENRVEISYWTFKSSEGKGIASWACGKLVSVAYDTDENIIVTAKTAPEKNASTKVLQRNGFIFSGIVQDHEIGDAWEWILPK
jgi:ribosomal-protein-alanine N-acetyltransferase